MECNKLFVYGTLMRKLPANHWSKILNEHANYLGEASIAGDLYNIDFYPGLVHGEGTVFGELYELKQMDILPLLDEYEDFRENDIENSLYLREKAKVQLSSGESVEAWVYYFNRSIQH